MAVWFVLNHVAARNWMKSVPTTCFATYGLSKAIPRRRAMVSEEIQRGLKLAFFPTSLWGFCFLACIASGCRGVPSAAPLSSHLTTTHLTPLISHNSSHTIHLTHNSSHTIHLTQFISHNSCHTQLISHNSSHTQLISHNSSHTTHLIHNSSHTQFISHNSSHTQLISQTTHLLHNSSHTQPISSHHTPLISHTHITKLISYTTHLTHTHITKLISYIHNSSHIIHNSSQTQLILHTKLISQTGAVHTASWRSCGADWQAQYTEPPEGAVARIVAAVAAARFCVAGAVRRASRRGLSPQWPRLAFVWQAQCAELPEGAEARIVAAVAAAALCVAGAVHRASWRSCGADVAAVAAAALCVAGAVHRASRRSCGADCCRSGRGGSLRGRRSTQSVLKELRRGLSPQWPRLFVVWQAQYTERPEGAAARIVAGVAAAGLCAAGAVHRASWRSCGADCRRSGRGCSFCGRRSTQSVLKELRRGLSPEWPRLFLCGRRSTQSFPKELRRGLSPEWPRRLFAWQDTHRASRRSCGADCCRSGRGCSLCGRRSAQSLLKELRRGLSPQWPRLACRRSYMGVCRGGVYVTDLCRRSYIGVCTGCVSLTDLRRRSYIAVCKGGVCVTDLCCRSYISVCRGGVSVTDLCRRNYIGVCRGGVSATDLCCRSFIGVCSL